MLGPWHGVGQPHIDAMAAERPAHRTQEPSGWLTEMIRFERLRKTSPERCMKSLMVYGGIALGMAYALGVLIARDRTALRKSYVVLRKVALGTVALVLVVAVLMSFR
jgi:hypothetical protein